MTTERLVKMDKIDAFEEVVGPIGKMKMTIGTCAWVCSGWAGIKR